MSKIKIILSFQQIWTAFLLQLQPQVQKLTRVVSNTNYVLETE